MCMVRESIVKRLDDDILCLFAGRMCLAVDQCANEALWWFLILFAGQEVFAGGLFRILGVWEAEFFVDVLVGSIADFFMLLSHF